MFIFRLSSSSSSDDPPYSSYLKDLATLRNPSSPITFLSYLHAHGRLLNFINRGCIIPTRKEFADYLGWVAQYVQDRGVEVKYGHEVIGLEEAPDGLIDVRVRAIATGETIANRVSGGVEDALRGIGREMADGRSDTGMETVGVREPSSCNSCCS